MSRDYWSLACHAAMPAVREVLASFFAQQGNLQRVRELPRNYGRCIEVAETAGWTLITASAAGSAPRLAATLSATLRTTVLVNDEHEASAFEHFAHIENGEPQILFTRFDEQIPDRRGVSDYADMLSQAVASGSVELTADQLKTEARSSYQGLTFRLLTTSSPLGPLAELWDGIVSGPSPALEAYTFAIHGSERLGRSAEATSWDQIMSREPVNLVVAGLLAQRVELDRAISALEQVRLPPAQRALLVIREQRAEVERALVAYDLDTL